MSMRSLLLLVITLLLPVMVKAQSESQAELKARLSEELAKDYVKFGGWETNFDQAKLRAKKEGKYIFAYFTRSYAY